MKEKVQSKGPTDGIQLQDLLDLIQSGANANALSNSGQKRQKADNVKKLSTEQITDLLK